MYLDEQLQYFEGLNASDYVCCRWWNYTSEWKSGSWICKNPLHKPVEMSIPINGRTSRQREILVQLMQKQDLWMRQLCLLS